MINIELNDLAEKRRIAVIRWWSRPPKGQGRLWTVSQPLTNKVDTNPVSQAVNEIT